jgi:hypothetical protein
MPRTQMNCPQCQQPIIADVQQLFDVGANPQDKQIFLSGTHNIAQCQSCGFQGMLGTPLVYHDPEKELLLTFVPGEMGLPMEEQERIIGPLITQVVNNLPQEQRKGYLFSPKTMLTMQGMLETVLEADGITKEMIQAQEERMNLIQRLMAASEEARLRIIEQEDEMIDGDLFTMLASLMQAAVGGQDEQAARHLNEIQRLLIENSTQGKALKADSDEIQAAMQALQDLGDNLTREALLELVVAAQNDVRLRAYVQFTRPGMDYEFFQLLSAQIDAASGDEKERLTDIRAKVLEFAGEYDEELAARIEASQHNVELLLQAPDLEEAVQQNLGAIDELFLQTVTRMLEDARKEGNLDRSSRLQQILNIVEQAAAPPPELALVEELMDFGDDEDALDQALEQHADEVTPELTQVLTSLIAQGQSVVNEVEDEQKEQQEKALASIQTVYEAVLRFAMRRSFKS